MISDDCEIKEFFEAVRGKPIREAISIANQEATEAERQQLYPGYKQETQKPGHFEYPELLKEFIRYIRYTVKPKIAEEEKMDLFTSYLNSTKTRNFWD